MGKMKILKTDGSKYDEECADVYEGQKPMRNRLMGIVGGYIEHVRVLYQNKYMYMIVNETGAVQKPPLPVNKEASHIYHTNMAEHEGLTIEQAFIEYPKIHGDAVLLFDCKLQ